MPRRPDQIQATPRSEDYLEVIYHLLNEKGYGSTVEIAERLEVKPHDDTLHDTEMVRSSAMRK